MNETVVTQESVQQVIATDKQQVIATTEVVSTIVSVGQQGPAGPVGPAGPTGATGPQGVAGPAGPAGAANLGGYGISLTALQTGDHLEFAGSNWVNVARETLSDGGNF